MILVTGATGFLGKRVCRRLARAGLQFTRTGLSLGTDLRERGQTMALFDKIRPTHVLNCAAFVGGIQFGYKHPVGLFSNNLLMTLNLLEASQAYGLKRLVNPISNCAYPARATLFKEDEFWDGPLHESVLVYGFARKASCVGSWAYARECGLDVLNLILSNMYGPEDHFEAERSHALGALIMKFATAKRDDKPFVDVWGSGKPVREWLHVDDGAEAMVRGLDASASIDPVNVGVGKGVSILEMAEIIRDMVGYRGELRLDPSKADGAPYKTVEGTRGAALLGWTPGIEFKTGVRQTIDWYLENNPEEHPA
jgi:GDP-L-fucose synthase